MTDEELQATVAATDGRTATYLREVVRRAALLAADRNPEGRLRVDGDLLSEAASGLLGDRAALTRALLGGADESDAEPPFAVAPPGGAFQPPMVRHMGVGWRSSRGLGEGEPTPFAPEG